MRGYLAVLIPLALSAAAQDAEQALFTFDPPEAFADRWAGQGELSAARNVPPEAAPEPSGAACEVTAAAGAVLLTKLNQVPTDWRSFAELRFRLYRPADAPPADFDVLLVEPDGATWFQRRVTTETVGWQEQQLPLKWFRWSDGRVPRWDRIARLAFRFRAPAHLWLDSIRVAVGADERAAELAVADLCAVAFPEREPTTVKVYEGSVLLLSDAAELDVNALGRRLEEVVAALRAELPFLPEPPAPPALIVFATAEAYRSFIPRFAACYAATAAPPDSQGYTLLGVAAGSWEPRWRERRPTYSHELVHAWLARSALRPNSGEWLQEGLASWIQLRFHPQDDFPEILRDGLANPDHRWPLPQLCGGGPIPLERYWQAATVVGMLLATPSFRERLPQLFAAFDQHRSTALETPLREIYGLDWSDFEAQWAAYVKRLMDRWPPEG